MSAADALRIAATVRNACVLAALDGYERAQIAGLCRGHLTWQLVQGLLE